MCRNELEVCGVATLVQTKGVGIRRLIEMVKANEYLELIQKGTNELNEEGKRELKHFRPHYLDAEAWDEKNNI